MIYFAKIRLFSALSCPSPEYPCQTFTQQLNLCGRKIVQPSPRRITRNITRITLQHLKNPLCFNHGLKRLISADVNDARLVSLWIKFCLLPRLSQCLLYTGIFPRIDVGFVKR